MSDERLLRQYPKPWRTTVAISIGNSMDFAIKEHPETGPEIIVHHKDGDVPLGKFTKARVKALRDYLKRLEIHAQ